MSKNWNDSVIALAGVFQSATLVQQLAKTGHVPNEEFATAVNSLFEQNPQNINDVYGDIKCLHTGLSVLIDTLKRKTSQDSNEAVRYVMGIIHLQRKLMKRNDMLNIIGTRLEQSKKQSEHFEPTHDNVIASLADIYTETISTFSFRIQVTGDYNYLQQKRIANQIRVLLFSGIRSAILWKQMGGSRLHVVLKRKGIIHTAEELLKQAKNELLH